MFWEEVRATRRALGMSREELARALGMSREELARALGVSLREVEQWELDREVPRDYEWWKRRLRRLEVERLGASRWWRGVVAQLAPREWDPPREPQRPAPGLSLGDWVAILEVCPPLGEGVAWEELLGEVPRRGPGRLGELGELREAMLASRPVLPEGLEARLEALDPLSQMMVWLVLERVRELGWEDPARAAARALAELRGEVAV